MIRPLAKLNLGIILKNTSIATVLIFGLAQTAEADETKKHQDLYIACNPGINLSSQLNCGFNSQSPAIEQGTDTQIAQGKRGRRRKSKVDGYYGGFTAGIGFAGGDSATDADRQTFGEDYSAEYTNSFDGSIFGGIKFTENIAADLEFLLALGGLDAEDTENILDAGGVQADINANFSAFALYASPRFELPITEGGKLGLYLSPGIGLSQTNINVNIENASGANVVNSNAEVDESQTGLSFQVKGGAEYQISETIDILAQARYAVLPTGGDLESIKIFGIETGLKFNF